MTALPSARPEMVIFPNLFVGRKKLRTFIFLRKKIIIISGQTLPKIGAVPAYPGLFTRSDLCLSAEVRVKLYTLIPQILTDKAHTQIWSRLW